MKLGLKIKGNTLPEILIALAILTVCSSLASIIYLNIQKSNLPFFKLKAVEAAEQVLRETKTAHLFNDDVIAIEGFSVKKVISRLDNFPDCLNVRLIVFSDKKRIVELNQIIFLAK